MYSPPTKEPNTLAIALGANLPSSLGKPISTLIAVRPEIEKIISEWLSSSLRENDVIENVYKELRLRWSPLFETEPIGGPADQPSYINAVLVVDGARLSSLTPSEKAAINLLERFLIIEKSYGRDREKTNIRWGPRSLDIDLLAWGALHIQNKVLTLPHPRLIERDFVVLPLAEALNNGSKKPRRIPPQENWQE